MSKRFAWLIGLGLLISIGLLVACGTNYNPSSDGLIVVGSQGSGLLETFSFSLSSGHNSAIANTPVDTSNEVCVLNGLPSGIVIDPAGAYAYTIINGDSPECGSSSATGLMAFKLNSDGTITQAGSLMPDPNPTALAMDSSGKFLFVAEGLSSTSSSPIVLANKCPGGIDGVCTCPGTTAQAPQYGVCVYAIGSGGTLTPVPATFSFALPTNVVYQNPNLAALTLTPTTFPGIGVNGVGGANCSVPGRTPPALEVLYMADSANGVVWEFGVNPSTGVLTNPVNQASVRPFPLAPTGAVFAGVSVDPCYRFLYVSNQNPGNNINAYTICNGLPTQSSNCPQTPDGSLWPITGSPFSLSGNANQPGPLTVDPFGQFLYVLDTGSSAISIFRISQVSGSLTASGTAATGLTPISMAIRADDEWLFVTNNAAATVSQYSITPNSGALTPMPAIGTDNLPWGVAVK